MNLSNKKVIICGGGLAGCFLAILLKKSFPKTIIKVWEREEKEEESGLGYTIQPPVKHKLESLDLARSTQLFHKDLIYWDKIHIEAKGVTSSFDFIPTFGVTRSNLLAYLRNFAEELGALFQYNRSITPEKIENLRQSCDLLIAAEGVYSPIRQYYKEELQTQQTCGKTFYIFAIKMLP